CGASRSVIRSRDGGDHVIAADQSRLSSAVDLVGTGAWATTGLVSTCTCQNWHEARSKRRMHGCGKDYKRGSHYKRQEIVNGHVGPSRLLSFRRMLTPPKEPRCDKCHC